MISNGRFQVPRCQASIQIEDAVAIERGVVGNLLVFPDRLNRIRSLVEPDDFVDLIARRTYEAILAIDDRGGLVDHTSVLQELRRDPSLCGADLTVQLADIGESSLRVGDPEYQARQIRVAATSRDIRRLAESTSQRLDEAMMPHEVLASISAEVSRLEERCANSAAGIVSFQDLLAKELRERAIVVDGLFRRGEVVNLIGDAKSKKSWLAHALAISVASETPFLNHYSVERGRVLLVDNELSKATLTERLGRVSSALGVASGWESELDLICLRGVDCSLADLEMRLKLVDRGHYSVIVLDAKYRFAGNGNENDNSSEGQLYSLLARLADRIEAAVVVVHHTTKGSQAGKKITDIGSGAGAQSRAADTHLVLRAHAERDCVCMEAVTRTFPDPAPVVLRWDFPTWTIADDLEPNALRGRRSATKSGQESGDRETADRIVEAVKASATPVTARKLRDMVGCGASRLERQLRDLVSSGRLLVRDHTYRGRKTVAYEVEPRCSYTKYPEGNPSTIERSIGPEGTDH